MTSENTSMMASGHLSNMPLYQQAKVVSRQYDLTSNDQSRLEKSIVDVNQMPYMHQRALYSQSTFLDSNIDEHDSIKFKSYHSS